MVPNPIKMDDLVGFPPIFGNTQVSKFHSQFPFRHSYDHLFRDHCCRFFDDSRVIATGTGTLVGKVHDDFHDEKGWVLSARSMALDQKKQ